MHCIVANASGGVEGIRRRKVTRADPAELELDQVRQLASPHYADEHNR
jgi:hypothetical protein